MPRIALMVLVIALTGCHYAGDPSVGMGSFLGDTHTFKSNPNAPVGAGENIKRVRGDDVASEPLLPEPGDVWPGPLPPEPTLADIEKQQSQDPLNQQQPGGQPTTPQPRVLPGSSGLDTLPPMPGAVMKQPSMPQTQTQTYQTPQGPASGRTNTGGPQTITLPGGGQGLVVPNGNGTSTVIAPDGSVTTIPTPK
jgi:hypothetical protein